MIFQTQTFLYDNFEISLVVFMPNITTNHAITYTKVYWKKLSNRKPTANTVRNTRQKKLYAECGVRLKNFRSSNFLCIFPLFWKPKTSQQF